MNRVLFALLVLCTSLPAAENVKLTAGKESIKVTIDGDVFTVFQFSPKRRKPYFLPVTGPNGISLLSDANADVEPGMAGRRVTVCTENAEIKNPKTMETVSTVALNEELQAGEVDGDWIMIPARSGAIHRSDVAPVCSTVTRIVDDNPPKVKDRSSLLYYDHPHHKGIWTSVDEVNGIKFWNEDGQIQLKTTEIVTAEGNPAVFKQVSHWLDDDGNPLVEESTTVEIFANRLMRFDITFKAVAETVEFHDTKEGMFAIRLTNSMREQTANGPVTNATGSSGTKALWGRTSPWIDYCGPIDENTFGVTIMDHPDNPRASRYHVRNYGLFGINPFGQEAYTNGRSNLPSNPLHLKQGETSRYRFGLFVHADELKPTAINEAFRQFAE